MFFRSTFEFMSPMRGKWSQNNLTRALTEIQSGSITGYNASQINIINVDMETYFYMLNVI
jgi:hypothetical protein